MQTCRKVLIEFSKYGIFSGEYFKDCGVVELSEKGIVDYIVILLYLNIWAGWVLANS